MRNRTSVVSPEKSIARIEQLLAAFGASQINKEYQAGKLVGVAFRLFVQPGTELEFRLPARVDRVRELLAKKQLPRTEAARKAIATQAERTAWKTMAEWCEIQLDLVRLGQAKPAEVFLPYIFNPFRSQTLFQQLESGGFNGLKALSPPTTEGKSDGME